MATSNLIVRVVVTNNHMGPQKVVVINQTGQLFWWPQATYLKPLFAPVFTLHQRVWITVHKR